MNTFFNYFWLTSTSFFGDCFQELPSSGSEGVAFLFFDNVLYFRLCCHYNSIIYNTLDVKSHWVWGAEVQFRNVHGMGAGDGLAQWAEFLPSKCEAPGSHPQRYTN